MGVNQATEQHFENKVGGVEAGGGGGQVQNVQIFFELSNRFELRLISRSPTLRSIIVSSSDRINMKFATLVVNCLNYKFGCWHFHFWHFFPTQNHRSKLVR